MALSNYQKKRNYFNTFTNNLDKAFNYYFIQARGNAKKRNINFDITENDLKSLYEQQDGLCALSGIKMTFKPGTRKRINNTKLSVDRINNSKGYTKDNIQLITWQANMAKGAWTNKQLINMCKNIIKHHSKLLESK